MSSPIRAVLEDRLLETICVAVEVTRYVRWHPLLSCSESVMDSLDIRFNRHISSHAHISECLDDIGRRIYHTFKLSPSLIE
jgi:hypothetical protein